MSRGIRATTQFETLPAPSVRNNRLARQPRQSTSLSTIMTMNLYALRQCRAYTKNMDIPSVLAGSSLRLVYRLSPLRLLYYFQLAHIGYSH
jgi:hypothetical protein